MRPLWRNPIAAPVKRFTGGNPIRHFVMAITVAEQRDARPHIGWDRPRSFGPHVTAPYWGEGSSAVAPHKCRDKVWRVQTVRSVMPK